jgi:hypothetical protein
MKASVTDEECSKVLDERKWARVQWLQNPSQTNGDNLNNAKSIELSGTK